MVRRIYSDPRHLVFRTIHTIFFQRFSKCCKFPTNRCIFMSDPGNGSYRCRTFHFWYLNLKIIVEFMFYFEINIFGTNPLAHARAQAVARLSASKPRLSTATAIWARRLRPCTLFLCRKTDSSTLQHR